MSDHLDDYYQEDDEFVEADEIVCRNCGGTFFWPSDTDPDVCPVCDTPFDGE
jgi:rubrerythrin